MQGILGLIILFNETEAYQQFRLFEYITYNYLIFILTIIIFVAMRKLSKQIIEIKPLVSIPKMISESPTSAETHRDLISPRRKSLISLEKTNSIENRDYETPNKSVISVKVDEEMGKEIKGKMITFDQADCDYSFARGIYLSNFYYINFKGNFQNL